MDLTVGNDALPEINRMELRSGRNLIKHAADSTDLDGTSATSKNNAPTPRRKSVNIKKSIGKEKENEDPDESRSRKSTQRNTNKRKSKLEEENEAVESSPLVDNVQTPNRTLGLSQAKKRRKSMQISQEHLAESSPLVDTVQTPNRSLGLSQTKKRRKSMQILQEDPDITCISSEELPGVKSSQAKSNRRKIIWDEETVLGTPTTSKENVQTPTRKSINIKRSVRKEKENEEPDVTCDLGADSPVIISSERKLNKRKSKLEQEVEVAPLVENAQSPHGRSSQVKITRKGMEILEEQPTPLVENAQSPHGRSSQVKITRKSMEILEEQPTETSPSVENAQSPHGRSSQIIKTRKSMQILEEQSIDKSQSRKSSQRKMNRRKSKLEEENEVAVTSLSVEESPGRKSSQAKRNRRESMWDGETEVVTTYTSEDTPGRKSSETKTNERKSKQEEENKESEFNDIVKQSQESEISSSLIVEKEEKNELSAPASDQNEEDVAEVLNSTFEVVEEDSILQTPARKRSVRFADKVETRRQSSDGSPKFSTPLSVNSKQRSSQHKGTPHPSAKKRPASILKNSSSKKIPSSSKDKSLRGTGSIRKMPDFNSIHKAQFEKMESIVDFSHRRHKCVRKLETQVTEDSDKQVQQKPSAIVKPMEQKTGNAVSRIPVAPQNISRSGTPRALSISHIPLAGFRVLTEKNFDARRSTPHTVNSRPSLKNVDARRSTPHTVNSRPSLKNVDARRSTPHTFNSRPSLKKVENNSRPKPVNNPKPQRITYEQAKATIQNKNPFTAASREAARLENRNLLKGVRLNRRFELQMQHRKINL